MKAPQPVSFVQPLITRGEEIRAVDPVVSYFCFYSAVRQVLEAKLHTSNSEVAEFATALLNEIETMKANSKSPELLENDEASRAHVLNFAALVFTKAENATHTQKVNKSTGAGFAAAAVFLGLESVWGELSPETQEKIKYAKFQATRILKALKNGEDPNDLYPKQPQPELEDLELEDTPTETLDETHGESKELDLAGNEDDVSKQIQPERIESERIEPESSSDHELPSDLAGAAHGGPRAPDLPRKESPDAPEEANDQEGLSESEEDANEGSITRLPDTPTADPREDIPLPHAPNDDPRKDISLPPAPAKKPEGNKSPPPVPLKAPKNEAPTRSQPVKKPNATPKPSSARTSSTSAAKPALRPEDIMSLTATSGSAQKHARYAISALNYDDIGTAVSELEQALHILRLYEKEHAN